MPKSATPADKILLSLEKLLARLDSMSRVDLAAVVRRLREAYGRKDETGCLDDADFLQAVTQYAERMLGAKTSDLQELQTGQEKIEKSA